MELQQSFIYGRPAGSLDTGWAGAKVTSDFGRRLAAKAERDTAALLDPVAGPSRATVLHDLSVPGGGGANIDHVLVVGRHVHLIDSKCWKPGFLWTVGGKTRRGWSATEGIDKDLSFGQQRLAAWFMARGVPTPSIDTTVVVWPSNTNAKLSLWAASNPAAQLVHARQLPLLLNKWTRRAKPANRAIVEALIPLLVTPPRPSGYVAAGLDF